MNKTSLLFLISLISANLFSQVYKLEQIYGDKATETYLSHWKTLENSIQNQPEIFSLWGFHQYFDDWANGAYEVEYFKGNAQQIFKFLSQVVEFTNQYGSENNILTYISDVKVKTLKVSLFKYTLVFDKEQKVACLFNLKQWNTMLTKFTEYCENSGIEYKS